MIREDRDPGFWNAVLNHPSVRPHVWAGTEELDLSNVLAQPNVVSLATTRGGFLLVDLGSERWELHTLFEPEGRGVEVLTAFTEAARRMFVRTDCREIVTKTAGTNRAAAFMARLAGFRPIFTRKGAWHDGSDLTFYCLSLDEWMMRDPSLAARGRGFHEMLERAKCAEGSELPTHPDDEAHDRAVGMACLMAEAGQFEKATRTYNRWAVFAGYQTVELIDRDRPVIDVRDALVTIQDGRMEVVECR